MYRQWAHPLPHSERRADRFVRDLLLASRQFLLGKFQFEPLQRYVLSHSDSPIVRQAVIDFRSRRTRSGPIFMWSAAALTIAPTSPLGVSGNRRRTDRSRWRTWNICRYVP